MKCALFSSTTIAVLVALAQPAASQDLANSIVGAWKLTDFTRKELATGTTAKPYGERPVGHQINTRGGNRIWLFVGENRKAPGAANATDAERAELFKTMAGCTETYKVQGDKLVTRCEAAWNQSWAGLERQETIEISGNTLTDTTAPFKSVQDGKEIVVVTKWERVE